MIKFRECEQCGGRAELRNDSCFWECSQCKARQYAGPNTPEGQPASWPYPEAVKPSDFQVGGDHYKDFAIQPSWYCHVNRLGHMASSIVKYATRAGRKGGADGLRTDLGKIKHYAELWLEYLDTEETKHD